MPGCPNLIERIEGGLLSYGNEMTRSNNPLEINLDRFCTLGGQIDYIGRPALEDISRDGPAQRIRGAWCLVVVRARRVVHPGLSMHQIDL